MKKLLAISVLSLLSSSIYANFFLPEISRDAKSLNTSVLAVSQESRNFAGLVYDQKALELDESSASYDRRSAGAYGALYMNDLSLELNTKFTETKRDGSQSSSEEVSLLTGYQVNQKMTLGLGYILDEFARGIDAQKLEAGGTLSFDGVVFAGSVAYRELKDSSIDGGYFILTAGAGKQEHGDSVEAGVQLMTEGSDDLTRGKRFSVFSNMTKVVDGVEIDGGFKFGFGNYYKDDGETLDGNNYTSLDFDIEAEFILAKNYYVTPGIVYSSSNAPGLSEDTSSFVVGSDFGYRRKNIDATLSVDYIFVGEENDVDYDGLGANINIAYIF